MSATSPAQRSYDVFVSDGPAGAGDERRPDGAPWRGRARRSRAVRGGRSAEGQLPALALIAASSLALAGRELGRLCNPGLPGHTPAKGRNVTENRNHGPFGRKRF